MNEKKEPQPKNEPRDRTDEDPAARLRRALAGGQRILEFMERHGSPSHEDLELVRQHRLLRELLDRGGRDNRLRVAKMFDPPPSARPPRRPTQEEIALRLDPDLRALRELISGIRSTELTSSDTAPAVADEKAGLPVVMDFAHPFPSKFEMGHSTGILAIPFPVCWMEDGTIECRATTGPRHVTPPFLSGECRAEAAFVVIAATPPNAHRVVITASTRVQLTAGVEHNFMPGGLVWGLALDSDPPVANGGLFLDFGGAEALSPFQRETLVLGPFGYGHSQITDSPAFVRRWFPTEPGKVHMIRFGHWAEVDNQANSSSDEVWSEVAVRSPIEPETNAFVSHMKISLRFEASDQVETTVQKGLGTPPSLPDA